MSNTFCQNLQKTFYCLLQTVKVSLLCASIIYVQDFIFLLAK